MPSKINWQFDNVNILGDDEQINEHFNVLDGEIKTNEPSDEPVNEFCQQKNPDSYHHNCYFGTLIYTPSLEHDGKIIQCSVHQDLFDNDYGRNINKRKIKLVVGAIKPQEILVRCQESEVIDDNEVRDNYTIFRYHSLT